VAITVRVLDLGELKEFVTADDLRAAAEALIDMQRARISEGKGSSGRPMKRYSKAYAEDRKAAGLPADGPRTLRRSGRMLDSRSVEEVTDKKAKIGFRDPQKYYYVQQRKSRFVKATKAERNEVSKLVRTLIRERLLARHSSARARKR